MDDLASMRRRAIEERYQCAVRLGELDREIDALNRGQFFRLTGPPPPVQGATLEELRVDAERGYVASVTTLCLDVHREIVGG